MKANGAVRAKARTVTVAGIVSTDLLGSFSLSDFPIYENRFLQNTR